MAEHSPTPWKKDARFPVIFTEDGSVGIADCRTVDTDLAIRDANAERIVACVNFGAGTDNEYLVGAGTLGQILAAAEASDKVLLAVQSLLPVEAWQAQLAQCASDPEAPVHLTVLCTRAELDALYAALLQAKGQTL